MIHSTHLNVSSTLVHCFGQFPLQEVQQAILLFFISRVTAFKVIAVVQFGCAGVVATVCVGGVGVDVEVTSAQLSTEKPSVSQRADIAEFFAIHSTIYTICPKDHDCNG